MDQMTIAHRTGIARRRLRYAIYHTPAPGVSRVEGGKGSVRHFTSFEAFGIALTSLLLNAGLRRELVIDCIDVLARRYGRETPLADIPLYRAFQTRGTARLDVGDRLYVRLRTGQA